MIGVPGSGCWWWCPALHERGHAETPARVDRARRPRRPRTTTGRGTAEPGLTLDSPGRGLPVRTASARTEQPGTTVGGPTLSSTASPSRPACDITTVRVPTFTGTGGQRHVPVITPSTHTSVPSGASDHQPARGASTDTRFVSPGRDVDRARLANAEGPVHQSERASPGSAAPCRPRWSRGSARPRTLHLEGREHLEPAGEDRHVQFRVLARHHAGRAPDRARFPLHRDCVRARREALDATGVTPRN